jgi:hypothetical protein
MRASTLTTIAIRLLMGMGEGMLLSSPIDRANKILGERTCVVITNIGKKNKGVLGRKYDRT